MSPALLAWALAWAAAGADPGIDSRDRTIPDQPRPALPRALAEAPCKPATPRTRTQRRIIDTQCLAPRWGRCRWRWRCRRLPSRVFGRGAGLKVASVAAPVALVTGRGGSEDRFRPTLPLRSNRLTTGAYAPRPAPPRPGQPSPPAHPLLPAEAKRPRHVWRAALRAGRLLKQNPRERAVRVCRARRDGDETAARPGQRPGVAIAAAAGRHRTGVVGRSSLRPRSPSPDPHRLSRSPLPSWPLLAPPRH